MKLRLPDLFKRRSSLIRTALPGFDPVYYLNTYPAVRETKMDPLVHFLEHGWKEGKDPSAGFSTLGYLAANPDVVTSGRNPLLHFLNDGFAEGRSGFSKSED